MLYYRRKRELIQTGLAGLTGFLKTTILRFETGQADCSLKNCERIAKALGIDTALLHDERLRFASCNLAIRIKYLRRIFGLSQAAFGKRIGVNKKDGRTVGTWPHIFREKC